MAARKKGMSLEQKRETMLSLFHETKEVFNLKELETKGAKLGVVQQTIKDVVQSLVDDRLVEQDKIGSGNFFWSFPSKALVQSKTRVSALETAIENDKKAIESLQARVKELSAARPESSDRAARLIQYEKLKAQKAELEKQVAALADCDPDAIKAMKDKIALARRGAVRWTDNVWVVKGYLVKKWGRDPKETDAMLGIDADFDYPT